MSVILKVESRRPVVLSDLALAASLRLREILNRDFGLSIDLVAESRACFENQSTNLVQSSESIVCTLAGYKDQALVQHLKIRMETTTAGSAEDVEDYFTVACRSKPTPLTWALVAGVAAGLATQQGSNVDDGAGFFTKLTEQSPDDFCRTLQVAIPQQDPGATAAAMYAGMPKSSEISEWLRANPE